VVVDVLVEFYLKLPFKIKGKNKLKMMGVIMQSALCAFIGVSDN